MKEVEFIGHKKIQVYRNKKTGQQVVYLSKKEFGKRKFVLIKK